VNRIRDELRRAQRRPSSVALESGVADSEASPLEQAIGAETLDRYDRALDRLTADERELIVARVELGLSYAEVAEATARASADAARMAVGRALLRLAGEMRADGRS
jgi:RNA polymerase sigma-70 factor (ECF subfamily)